MNYYSMYVVRFPKTVLIWLHNNSAFSICQVSFSALWSFYGYNSIIHDIMPMFKKQCYLIVRDIHHILFNSEIWFTVLIKYSDAYLRFPHWLPAVGGWSRCIFLELSYFCYLLSGKQKRPLTEVSWKSTYTRLTIKSQALKWEFSKNALPLTNRSIQMLRKVSEGDWAT